MSKQQMSDSAQASAGQSELDYDEFAHLASRAGVPAELWRELYPMVRDLRALAAQINALTPPLHDEISTSALQAGTGD
jgi:hypothetical protein